MSRIKDDHTPIAWADKIAFLSAMDAGKGCDVWPTSGDYEARTGRELMPLYGRDEVTNIVFYATLRALDEAGVRNEVLRGMCLEVAQEKACDMLDEAAK